MAGTYTPLYSDTPGVAWGGTVDIDNTRRTFSISDTVHLLEPQRDLFFAYLNHYRKEGVAETVWKPLTGRAQWQRRDFAVDTAFSGTTANGAIAGVKIFVNYDKYGRLISNTNSSYSAYYTWAPIWKIVGQTLVITDDQGDMYHFRITTVNADDGTDGTNGNANLDLLTIESCNGKTFPAYSWDGSTGSELNGRGEVMGSQYAEAGYSSPDGYRDEFVADEFYAQRFHTGISLMSDSMRATEYRGVKDEFQRVFDNHVLAHRRDMSLAMIHGYGKFVTRDLRFTWGAIPWITSNGKVYDFTYGATKYDDMIDMMEDFTAPELGNSMDKVVFTSRKIISWLNKLDVGQSFFGNTGGASAPFLDITNIPGEFGHEVSVVKSNFGRLHFVQEANLRGPAQNYAIMIDLANVSLRPVEGNGISLDTYVRTNVQENDETGRKDDIITEAGVEFIAGESHGLLKFS